jgi:hypothetical protein
LLTRELNNGTAWPLSALVKVVRWFESQIYPDTTKNTKIEASKKVLGWYVSFSLKINLEYLLAKKRSISELQDWTWISAYESCYQQKSSILYQVTFGLQRVSQLLHQAELGSLDIFNLRWIHLNWNERSKKL